MGVSSVTYSNPYAWGLPVHGARVHPDRVIVPQPKPFDAAPGVVPYHRYLQAQNQIAQIQADALNTACPIKRGCDCVELSDHAQSMARLLPKLGEVLPVTPMAQQVTQIVTTQQQVVPATGQVLDQFA